MKRVFSIMLALLLAFSAYAQKGKDVLTPDAFETRMATPEGRQLVDVRTPEEFRKEHIDGALNIDVNSAEFQQQVAALDKSQPVMVYCLSGGRSAKAADYMRKSGFKKVYELDGGILQWNASKKPTVATVPKTSGMTLEQFYQQTKSEKLVLVDFHAKWCAPCKKMAPWLDSIATRQNDTVSLLKIDADANTLLVDALKVSVLPTLYIFKDGKQVWSRTGLIEQAELEKIIASFL